MSVAVASVIGLTAGRENDAPYSDEMAYERPEYSRADIKKAGKTRYLIDREDDYIAVPTSSGYRRRIMLSILSASAPKGDV